MKFLKRLGIVLLVIAALFYFVGMPYMKRQTKKYSPEKMATYTFQSVDLEVSYSSPSKKDRVIFGELVPYGQVWRTGANEPTTFSNTEEIKIIDKSLPAGKYSLWTIPNKNSWKVIFNKKIPEWGVTFLSNGKETTRNPNNDVLTVEVPIRELMTPVENFTINFENEQQLYLSLSWDTVKVSVPINP